MVLKFDNETMVEISCSQWEQENESQPAKKNDVEINACGVDIAQKLVLHCFAFVSACACGLFSFSCANSPDFS